MGGTRSEPATRRRRAWAWVVLAAVVIGFGVPFVRRGVRGTTELPVYTIAAERLAAGEEIYRHDDRKPFTYPPFFAVPFLALTPLGHVPLDPPRPGAPVVAWYVGNVLALAMILRLLHRRLVPAAGGRALALWGITGVLAARHVSAVFENQSHDLFVFLACLLGIEALARARNARGGGWFGVGTACKATPALFGWVLLVQGRCFALAGLGAAAAAATSLPDVLFPRADGRLWGLVWWEMVRGGVEPGAAASGGAWTAGSMLNQSLSGTLHRLLTPVPASDSRFVVDVAVCDPGPGLVKAVTLVASAAVLAWLARLAWMGRREPAGSEGAGLRRYGEGAAVLCGMVLLSPMSSKSHFCVLLAGMAFCAAAWLRRRDVLLAGWLVIALVLGTLSAKDLVGREWGNRLLAHGSVTWTALAVLAGVARVLRRWPFGGRG